MNCEYYFDYWIEGINGVNSLLKIGKKKIVVRCKKLRNFSVIKVSC